MNRIRYRALRYLSFQLFNKSFTNLRFQQQNILTYKRGFSSSQKPNNNLSPGKLIGIVSASAAALIGSFCYQYLWSNDEAELLQTQQKLGIPDIGGDFHLTDQYGKARTLKDFEGKWLLVYFGFCHCPDICPEQLDRLSEIYERLKHYGKSADVVPLFITIDPDRDTSAVMKEYIKDFSSEIIGLTGPTEEIKRVAKKYRIYYSLGEKDKNGDYIVDHTIITYLFNPNGECTDLFGQYKPVQDTVRLILERIKEFGPPTGKAFKKKPENRLPLPA